jgi:porin
MTLSAFDLSPGVSDFRVCLLLAAFGIVAGQHRVRGDDQGAAEKTDTSPIAERIGAVDVRTGTGELADSLEKSLGLPRGTGVFLGGVWVADANCVLSGGADPSKWSFNRLLIVGAGLDAEKLVGWPGGRFGVEFLQFNGEHTNQQAGSVQGYNSLPGPPPLHRSELYQLWWRQELFDGKLIVRVGKMVPTADFNNVLRPVPTQDQSLFIPSVSGLLFTPVFVNPTLQYIDFKLPWEERKAIKYFPDFEREFALKACEAWQNKKDRHPY